MVKKNKFTFSDWLQTGIIRASRVHFWFIGIYAVYIIASDATHLITPVLVYQRWLVNGSLLGITGLVWYAARARSKSANFYRFLLYSLITTDTVFATFNVYTQRGMASRAVLLFTVPILLSGLLLSRVATLTTATISSALYAIAAVKYFTDFFNEGYKAELYIEVGFYIACFYVLSLLLNVIISFRNTETELGL